MKINKEDISKIKTQILNEMNNGIVNIEYKNSKIGYHVEKDIK